MSILLHLLVASTALCFLVPIVFPGGDQAVYYFERIICGAFFLTGLLFIWRRERTRDILPRFRLVIWIVFAGSVAHLGVFTWSARTSLFLADQDITNISSAIANTANGFGILPTAYVHTGESGSYLGHHFAPALLFLLPAYLGGNILGLDHFVYPASLFFVSALGLLVWIRLIGIKFSDDALSSVLAACMLLNAFPLLRLSQSFHNEMFVILFSGLFFLALELEKTWLIYSAALLWMMVKEDTSVYVALIGVFLAIDQQTRHNKSGGRVALAFRSQGFRLALFALSYFATGHLLQAWFGGKTGPDWSIFFHGEWPQVTTLSIAVARPIALVGIVGAFAFLPLTRPLFSLVAILPIAVLHLLSNHPWHSTYYGHYAYAILPFLMYGSLLGIHRVSRLREEAPAGIGRFFASQSFRTGLLCFCLGISFYFNSGDRQTPGKLFKTDPEYGSAWSLAREIPKDYCVFAERNLSPLVPVDRLVLPLAPVEGNPNFIEGSHGLTSHCKKRLEFIGFEKPSSSATHPARTVLKQAGRFSLREVN
ncbi:MAG: DUF2079 domain-containing protein [Leptospirales bacterium]|nr:DUF2079 domain-containing protein [Leptospirales bacterium]